MKKSSLRYLPKVKKPSPQRGKAYSSSLDSDLLAVEEKKKIKAFVEKLKAMPDLRPMKVKRARSSSTKTFSTIARKIANEG